MADRAARGRARTCQAALTRTGWAGRYPSAGTCPPGTAASIRPTTRCWPLPARGGNPAARRFPVARPRQDGGGRDAGAADQHALPRWPGCSSPWPRRRSWSAAAGCRGRTWGLPPRCSAACPANGASSGRARPSTPSARSRRGSFPRRGSQRRPARRAAGRPGAHRPGRPGRLLPAGPAATRRALSLLALAGAAAWLSAGIPTGLTGTGKLAATRSAVCIW